LYQGDADGELVDDVVLCGDVPATGLEPVGLGAALGDADPAAGC
jgi:hypothetical protein